MPEIYLETLIQAPIDRVFDLARSIDFHKYSTKHTNEDAIAGKTSGLIDLHETVTWRAGHFGFYQNLTVKITEYNRPFLFVDRMLNGAFKTMTHIHRFESLENDTVTKMCDVFEFTSPFNLFGKIAEKLILRNYMKRLLLIRNSELKFISEGEKWKDLLQNPSIHL